MGELKLICYVGAFGRVCPTEKFNRFSSQDNDYYNQLLFCLVVEEGFYGDRYEVAPGFYNVYFELYVEEYHGGDEHYLQVKKIGNRL